MQAERAATDSYRSFLRATHPFVVLTVAFTFAAAVAIAIGPRASHAMNGSEPPDFAFDAAIIILTLAFGWPSRSQWSAILWNGLRIIDVVSYVGAALVLALSAAILQGHFATQSAVLASRLNAPAVLIATVFAPVAESIFLQGWLQSALEKWVGSWMALGITALVFIGIHFTISMPLLVVVIILCVIRMRTGSLGTVILAHAAVNSSMYFLP